MIQLHDEGPEKPEGETEVKEAVDDMLKNIISGHKKIFKIRDEESEEKE